MRVNIKNMVCPRCIMVVEQILETLVIPFHEVNIGFVNLDRPLSTQETIIFERELYSVGFEILKDRKQKLVEDIKIALHKLVNAKEETILKTSELLSEKFNLEYSYLSNVFSEIQGESIEKFLINLKIEKVKELLSYKESLREIASQLQYSSVAHLSTQFKKATGLSPSEFKKQII